MQTAWAATTGLQQRDRAARTERSVRAAGAEFHVPHTRSGVLCTSVSIALLPS
jgi:hypothetical protein